jgi:hypothetical protein
MALPLIGTVFRIAKSILAPKIAQVLNAPQIDVEKVLAKAQELAETDKEVELALIEQEKALQGSYAELKTTFEKVLRSVVYHLITLGAALLIGWSVYAHTSLDPKILYACLAIVLGRTGFRVYEHFKGGENKCL